MNNFLKVLLLLAMFRHAHCQALGNNEISVDGTLYSSISEAQNAIKEGSRVILGPGIYSEGLKIVHNNVLVSGVAGQTKFYEAVVSGKGTFVVSGDDIVIENIECSGVAVSDNNGACVRQEGKNLTLSNVYFHHSQQGVLSAGNTGFLLVEFSRFEFLGKAGKAHGIYSGNDKLVIRYSDILNSVDQGHEVKSRAANTIIEYSRIGSLTSDDSRSIEIPSGGDVTITNSIIMQGPGTVNRQILAYGVETLARNRNHSLTVSNNLLILEREGLNELLGLKDNFAQKVTISFENNYIVGEQIIDIENYEASNYVYESRTDANIIKGLVDLNVINALYLMRPMQ